MPAPKGNKFALGNKGGRPTKYDPRFCGELVDFFDKPKKKGNKPNELPSIRKFAKRIGVDHNTISAWAKENKEFLTALETAKLIYKEWLIENGLEGLYNSAFAKFVAINTTDMVDKQEVAGTLNIDNLREKYV